MNYESSAKIPLWRPAAALLGEHRGLVRSMARRDLSSRYKGSIIGPAWAIITPAVMIIIFTVIFSEPHGAARSQLPPNTVGGNGAGLAGTGRDDGLRTGLFRLRLLVVSKDEEGFR